jgi:DNA-binding GntR family transcriptional regulator
MSLPRPRARSSPARRAAPTLRVSGTLDQTVYDTLFDAVMQGRLKPGERLGEAGLCEQFQVSRTVVRQALRRLAESQIVEIVPNKGATVAAPSPEETHEVFEARRAIEGAIVRAVAARIGTLELQRLQSRLEAEHAALHEGDHGRWVALAGGFHLALAQLCGNRVLQRLLTELMTRCSLIVALYEAPGEASCEHDEHQRIVELLGLRDGDGAAALMDQHLRALESRLALPRPIG